MIKKILLFTGLLLNLFLFGQTSVTQTQYLTYQAVVRAQSNSLAKNIDVNIKVSLINKSAEGTVNYVENHTVKTNDNGLLTIKIGAGSTILGDYNNFKWYDGPVFLKTEITFKDQWNIDFEFINTSELLSVPYSNFAYRSGGLIDNAEPFVGEYHTDDADADYEALFISRETKNSVQIRLISSSPTADSVDTDYGKIIDDKIEIYHYSSEIEAKKADKYAILTKNGEDILLRYFDEDDGTLIDQGITYKKAD